MQFIKAPYLELYLIAKMQEKVNLQINIFNNNDNDKIIIMSALEINKRLELIKMNIRNVKVN